ncbi:hypothetical protein BHE74_00013657 [Ensete ventricosum]|nr:hypothetical protein GW17_00018322 [Ensete ventricosum]RWW78131.1 hypothetical protein BHE74_00013657 [Ensete ventricosum]RZR92952.1 hypothetical protein BHM03_00021336 [Ensete ventricosum]
MDGSMASPPATSLLRAMGTVWLVVAVVGVPNGPEVAREHVDPGPARGLGTAAELKVETQGDNGDGDGDGQ